MKQKIPAPPTDGWRNTEKWLAYGKRIRPIALKIGAAYLAPVSDPELGKDPINQVLCSECNRAYDYRHCCNLYHGSPCCYRKPILDGPEEKAIWDALPEDGTPFHLDAILKKTRLSFSTFLRYALALEIRDIIEQQTGKNFARKN